MDSPDSPYEMALIGTEVERDPFWDFFEQRPEHLAQDGDIVGTWGIVLGLLTALGQFVLQFLPVFLYGWHGFTVIEWQMWIEIGALAIVIGWQIWGLVVHLRSQEQPNAATAFRAWRVNFLASFVHIWVMLASSIIWLIWQAVWNIVPSQWNVIAYIWKVAFHRIAAFISFWLIFWLKDNWYLRDNEGAKRDEYFCMFCSGEHEFVVDQHDKHSNIPHDHDDEEEIEDEF